MHDARWARDCAPFHAANLGHLDPYGGGLTAVVDLGQATAPPGHGPVQQLRRTPARRPACHRDAALACGDSPYLHPRGTAPCGSPPSVTFYARRDGLEVAAIEVLPVEIELSPGVWCAWSSGSRSRDGDGFSDRLLADRGDADWCGRIVGGA